MKRSIRVCYFNLEPRIVTAAKATLESTIGLLGDVKLQEIQSLEDPQLMPCDLLMISAQHLAPEQIKLYLSGLSTRMKQQASIWIPALIFANLNLSEQTTLISTTLNENWYYDIVHEDHLDSFPMRVANLLKIHDHLHELKRYESSLAELSLKVRSLEQGLRQKDGETTT